MATLKSIIAGIAIALSAALLNPLYADEPQPPKQRSNVEINQMKGDNPVERSLPYFVEVWYDRNIEVLEFTCHGLGPTEVYIVDSFGNVVNTRTFNSDYEPFIILDAPTIPGTCYLVIIADGYYGEGMFNVE